MDAAVRAALDRSQVVDLTTTGRRTGQPRRIEIFIHNIDGQLVISGIPRAGATRAWLRNAMADPSVILHYRGLGPAGDLAARARVVTDPGERRSLLERVATNWNRTDVDRMVEHSPLMVVTVPGYPG